MSTVEDPLPEQLFLDYRVADVLDKNVRLPRVEPWASQYCAAISEKRYGDAIWARYHMDGRAIDGVYTDLRQNEDGSCERYNIAVYDMIMEDARSYASECADLYQEALLFYNNTSPNDGRRDIIEGLAQVGVGSNFVCLPILHLVQNHYLYFPGDPSILVASRYAWLELAFYEKIG